MDFDNTQNPGNTDQPQPTPPQHPQTPPATNIPDFSSPVYNPYPPKKKGSGWKIFWGIVITLSLLANGVMFIAMIGIAAMGPMLSSASSASVEDNLREKVLISGSHNRKIAVINITGVIDNSMRVWVDKQIKKCGKDSSIRGLIVRINSPGGAVSSSDQIHYAIGKFKKEYPKKPVLCFMQGIAASGGYYSAVACDEIMAEPTTITGSIGVIMNIMVVKELLEEKLGIDPVTIKSGARKDWPSMYNDMTDEQEAYLKERIIMPSYERFVDLIAEGRQDVLTRPDILKLADGSIYTAQQAVDNKLIDDIGYLDDAVDRIQQLANVSGAQVVEYEEVFSVWNILGAEAKAKAEFNLETELLEKIAAPRILYLWDGRR